LCCHLLSHLSAIDNHVFNILLHFADVISVYLNIKNEKMQLLLVTSVPRLNKAEALINSQ